MDGAIIAATLAANHETAHAVRDDVHPVVALARFKFSQSFAELLGMPLN